MFDVYYNTAAVDKATQVFSKVTKRLMIVEQLLNKSEAALVAITERNANFSSISSMVHKALDDAKIRHNDSQSFLQGRMLDNITANNVNNQLTMLLNILQDQLFLSSNVLSTINNTVIYNKNLALNITRLQVFPYLIKTFTELY